MMTNVEDPKPGEVWQHYKGSKYRIICIAQQEEGKRRVVVYCSMLFQNNVWTRPVSQWHGTVLVNKRRIPRFIRLVEDVSR